jgi:hypothetical protein
MSINKSPKADGIVPESSTTKKSNAAISEVHLATDERKLRNIVFTGVRTKQIEIKNGTAQLANEATALFVGHLAAAVQEVIVLAPGITPRDLGKSRDYLEKMVQHMIAEYLRELKAATSAIDKNSLKSAVFSAIR